VSLFCQRYRHHHKLGFVTKTLQVIHYDRGGSVTGTPPPPLDSVFSRRHVPFDAENFLISHMTIFLFLPRCLTIILYGLFYTLYCSPTLFFPRSNSTPAQLLIADPDEFEPSYPHPHFSLVNGLWIPPWIGTFLEFLQSSMPWYRERTQTESVLHILPTPPGLGRSQLSALECWVFKFPFFPSLIDSIFYPTVPPLCGALVRASRNLGALRALVFFRFVTMTLFGYPLCPCLFLLFDPVRYPHPSKMGLTPVSYPMIPLRIYCPGPSPINSSPPQIPRLYPRLLLYVFLVQVVRITPPIRFLGLNGTPFFAMEAKNLFTSPYPPSLHPPLYSFSGTPQFDFAAFLFFSDRVRFLRYEFFPWITLLFVPLFFRRFHYPSSLALRCGHLSFLLPSDSPVEMPGLFIRPPGSTAFVCMIPPFPLSTPTQR